MILQEIFRKCIMSELSVPLCDKMTKIYVCFVAVIDNLYSSISGIQSMLLYDVILSPPFFCYVMITGYLMLYYTHGYNSPLFSYVYLVGFLK